MSYQQLSRVFLTLSALAVIASAALFFAWGPRFSIEFTGGTLMEVQLPDGKTKEDLTKALEAYDAQNKVIGHVNVSAITGVQGTSYLARFSPITNEQHVALLASLQKTFGTVTELKFTTIGPSVSASLKQKSLIAISVSSVAIILYLAFAFRKLPKKLNPWKVGVLAVIAFIHDVVVVAGIFVVLSHFTSFEFDTLFVTALLTILAYSANDTIVIFDRIRANLALDPRGDLNTVIIRGLRESVTRTFNTAIAALIMLTSLFFLGSDAIRWFILALIAGTIIGAYSSYFIAAALLLYWK